MNIFKNRGNYTFTEQKTEEPKTQQGTQVASASLPSVGSVGYFSNSATLKSADDWTQGEISGIEGNRFHTDSEIWKYFIPYEVFDPEDDWTKAAGNVYQVAFGRTVCIKRGVEVARGLNPSARNIDDVIRVIDNHASRRKQNQGEQKLVPGCEYLFTDDPRGGFFKGVLLIEEEGKGFKARMQNGDNVYFLFCIKEEDYKSGKRDKLLCAVNPEQLALIQGLAPRKPYPMAAQPMAPATMRPNMPPAPQGDDRELQQGDSVYYAFRLTETDWKKGKFISVDKSGNSSSFVVTDSDGRATYAPYVIPASMVRNRDIEHAKKFYLAVRNNGEIYAPNFQR